MEDCTYHIPWREIGRRLARQIPALYHVFGNVAYSDTGFAESIARAVRYDDIWRTSQAVPFALVIDDTSSGSLTNIKKVQGTDYWMASAQRNEKRFLDILWLHVNEVCKRSFPFPHDTRHFDARLLDGGDTYIVISVNQFE